jgi:hypothetical protein
MPKKPLRMSSATFGKIALALQRCSMRGFSDRGFSYTRRRHESCVFGRVRTASKENEAKWMEQIRAVYERILGAGSVTEIRVRPTIKNYWAFDVFTVKKWL